ncbi:hypothetical protein Nepgr_005674 [Nepenthes gracilis]|uniref:Uncharacterized protein n=1 Tax=Nepenthes gracilis TaxID=150966 RepID=A0AAD3S3L3_NEPGR|nr:hypothetical protein Nepgr_005674 [Nepenthes gracilis]
MCFPSFSSNLRTFTMFTHIFLVLLLTISFLIDARPAPRGFLINCGSSENITVRNLKFIADEGLISVGNTTALKMSGVLPVLSTLRLFPDVSARKYCYVLPAVKGTKYLVRTTYYYGGFDGGNQPPIFDQIVDGTKWSVVNTTDDYANGLASYYELVVAAHMNELSVCLARNQHTGKSSPFISALEVMFLGDSVYGGIDFDKYVLHTVARKCFGAAEPISFPDDEFHRFWQPFKDTNPTVTCQSNVTPSDFWNMPPVKALKNAITTSRGKTLQIQWLPVSLPPSNYYISLYFQDNRNPSAYSWRVFNISINGELFYSKLNVTAKGVSVYAIEWPLSGQTRMTLIPEDGIPVGPLINAAEVLQILPLGGMTLTRDVMAMEDLARSLDNAPADWHGDPCLPQQNSWTGVTCSGEKNVARVVTLNLTSMGLTGSLPPSIVNLTAVNNIWLAHNKLSGLIPDISSLKVLETFHLDNNQFEGSIPKSLGELPRIQEIYLQHNNLEGEVPESLRNRPDVDIRLTPRNNLRESKNNG